eukprot:Gb_27580 [translate_table: standard]
MCNGRVLFVFVNLFINVVWCLSVAEAWNKRQSYVVYLGGHDEHEVLEHEVVASSHYELLASVLGSKEAAKESIFYSYSRCINGFAAHLEPEHAMAVSKLPGVVSVFANRGRSLHTTRSWKFLGLEYGGASENSGNIPVESLWRKSEFGNDVIIANLDTGVWPEAASFHDTGMGPIPSRWKGICQNGTDFGASYCNRKLIGARYFLKGYEAANGPLNLTATGEFLSARDRDGHGTHTLSTAGGSFVERANVYGFGEGTAKGGAPHARVAAYKVCWPPVNGNECYDADILAAFDAGIQDGVDVFSVSLGSSAPLPDYFLDGTAIGAFHAVQRGKVVVCSAGNDGPAPRTVANVAPWILTVGASSTDRQFPSTVLLGNNKTYRGQSLSNTHLPKKGFYPLVSSLNVKAPHANQTAGQLCFRGALDPKKVKGKIVACLRGINARVEKGEAVRMAGGVGMILCNAPLNANEVVADAHVLPATQLNAVDGAEIFHYINTTKSPVAYISSPKTELDTKPAPVMTAFSSQGPNSLTPDILKPDITAPGLNILAAYSKAASPTGLPFDHRHIPFNVISGTSMSCPHVSGIVALLKAAHPHWSPAAIRSSIMTTAFRMDNTKEPIKTASLEAAGPFNYGAGHVNPNAAVNPGLVYDLSNKDYYRFLCSLSYSSTQTQIVTGKNFSCPLSPPKTYNINYPSITVSDLKGTVHVKRTLTNVGEGSGVYVAKAKAPPGVKVTIKPKKLEFSEIGEKKSFTVKLKARRSFEGNYVHGHLTWSDGEHLVRSPIVVNAVTAKHTK